MKRQDEKTYAPNADLEILRLMETFFPNSKTALDLGCGLGGNLLAIKNIGLSVTGVTISPQEAKVVSQFSSVYTHDLEKGLPAEVIVNKYDVVIAAHVLEHIFYPDQLLTDVQRITRRGVIVVIPNLLFWRNRAKMLLGIFEYQDLGIMDYTHSRWYTFETIQRLLVQRGFVIKLATATGGLFGETTSFFKKAIDSLLIKCLPGLFGFQFYIVASNSK